MVCVRPIREFDDDHRPWIGSFQHLGAAVRSSWKQDLTAWIDASANAYVGKGLPGCDASEGLVEWT